MRIAYICNAYPAVSHSFIRREIEGVEAAGHHVVRFSLRPPSNLRDPADLRESANTEVVLSHGILRLILAWGALLLSRPVKSLKAISAALKLSGQGIRPKIFHVAYLLEAAWLTRRLSALKIDHLHAHFGTNPAAVALLVTTLGGPPYSLTIHGSEEFDAPVALALAKKVEAAAFVAVISSFTRSQVMRWSKPSDWNKIKIVRCGVDQVFLRPNDGSVADPSREFVCVTRLSFGKGLTLLVGACERLSLAKEDFLLTIVGDGECRQDLQAEISKRGLQQLVTLVGTRSSAEIREHLLRARAFVLPSFAEGLPVVLMEALALSRPVITTFVGGIPELVDSKNGWLIPAGSEDALMEAMSATLRASAKELIDKGTVGRERVARLHDSAKNAALLSDAICEYHRHRTA